MSRKHFIWLFLVTVAAAVLVLLYPSQTVREAHTGETVFIPEMIEQVNDIDWLRLSAAGGETVVTLRRDEGSWVVEEASGYRADWGLVKSLLGSLSRAEVIEQKTSNPGLYAKLGVEDVTAPDASGVMIEFSQDSGLPAVIIGHLAQGRDGQYARSVGSDNSVLIGEVIDLPKEKEGWLDTSIADISDAEVVEFEISNPAGGPVRAVKASAEDENFELQNVPDGREIDSDWAVNAPANSLAALEFQAVVPESQINWDEAVRFRLLTADGLTVETEVATVQFENQEATPSEHWIRLQAGVYSAADTPDDQALPSLEATTTRAEQINTRTQGWAYQIPGYRVDSMTRSLESMLKPVSDDP